VVLRHLKVINIGPPHFAQALQAQGASVRHVAWQPPGGGDLRLAAALDRLSVPAVDQANRKATEILLQGQPFLIDVARAGDVIPGLTRTTILHSGPPNAWETMAGPQRGAVIGALLLEGLAATPEEAEALAASGEIAFRPNNDCGAVGPMAGVTSFSSAVWVVENRTYGNRAYCNLNEGFGKVLRMGAYSPEVLERLRWLNTDASGMLGAAVRSLGGGGGDGAPGGGAGDPPGRGGLDLRAMVAQALHMGDECHNRNKAASSLFLRAMAGPLARVAQGEPLARLCDFLAGNEIWFLNLAMAACKAVLDAAREIPHSSVVTCMARNGYQFGLQIAGLPGRWFTGPAQMVRALYFPGFTEADAAPDIGDSVITETAGLGGFAMAAAPAIVQFVGGTPAMAAELTREMYEITLAESPHFTIPAFGFRGTPTGIDIRKVVETGILPSINTGVAHRLPGIGQVGAGLVRPPASIFSEALLALAATL
jgi:hypothetical protein